MTSISTYNHVVWLGPGFCHNGCMGSGSQERALHCRSRLQEWYKIIPVKTRFHKNVLENLMRSGTSLIYQQSDALRNMPSLLPSDHHWCQLRETGLKGNNGGQVKRKFGRETDKLGNEQLQSKRMVDRHHFLSCHHMNLWFTKRLKTARENQSPKMRAL